MLYAHGPLHHNMKCSTPILTHSFAPAYQTIPQGYKQGGAEGMCIIYEVRRNGKSQMRCCCTFGEFSITSPASTKSRGSVSRKPREARARRILRSLGALLLLREIDRLAFQHMQQGLRRLENLHVSGLSLLYSLVVLIPGLCLTDKAFVDLLQTICEDGELLLDLSLILLFLQNLLIQLFALLTEVLNRLHKLVVVVLQRRALGCHRLSNELSLQSWKLWLLE